MQARHICAEVGILWQVRQLIVRTMGCGVNFGPLEVTLGPDAALSTAYVIHMIWLCSVLQYHARMHITCLARCLVRLKVSFGA